MPWIVDMDKELINNKITGYKLNLIGNKKKGKNE